MTNPRSILAPFAALLLTATYPWALLAQTTPPPAPVQAPAHAEPGYKTAPGPYEVGVIDKLVLRDDAREKDLEMTVRYPKIAHMQGQEGTTIFPLVIFSHGAGGSRGVFPELTTHWASHGYVVIAPTHSDSIAQRRDKDNVHFPCGSLA